MKTRNYTNPDDKNYEDKPEDWLNSSLIFAKALGMILEEKQGIVIELEGSMKETLPDAFKKQNEDRVVIIREDNMVRVIIDKNLPIDLPDGQLISFD